MNLIPTLSPLSLSKNFQGESLAEHQSVIVASGPHETSVMRIVARTPAFIQLESEDKLTGLERITRSWGEWVVLNGGESCASHPLSSITGSEVTVIPLVRSFKPDKPFAV